MDKSNKLPAGLISGLVYNKPEDPLTFLENAITKIRQHPEREYSWDMFNDDSSSSRRATHTQSKLLAFDHMFD
uniref:DUF2281 domain-containing protein n=1 Tax=Syphacia muris TaxID=451379 RepID=A0A0N5B0R4_9BILA